MKNNCNNKNKGEYYLGLDIGTDSVGWAVTDTTPDYNILRFKGNLMQGVRLFDEANDCKERRSNRTNRRRLARRKQRLTLVENLFYNEIIKIDPTFFIRMKNSFLFPEDRDPFVSDSKYTLFNDENFTDIDYIKKYPTVYHLRSDLVHNNDSHDIRLVFLAVHHILKKRGHFLFDGVSENDITIDTTLDELKNFVADYYNTELILSDEIKTVLMDTKSGVTNKKKAIMPLVSISSENSTDKVINEKYIAEILAGTTTDMGRLFVNDSYSGTKVKLNDDLDEKYDELYEVIGDDIDLIVKLKTVYDTARLNAILGDNSYICDSKVDLYNKNKNDLHRLKEYVKTNIPEKYNEIFSEKKDKLNNLAAYIGKDSIYHCSQVDFCKYLRSSLASMKNNNTYSDLWNEISEDTFLTKLSSKENGLIPNQIHKKELKKILENASEYLPFLNIADEYGSVADKILATFDFKIPYYIGPLNNKSDKAWVVRTNEKITPWNITSIVNYESSAVEFMNNLIGKCEYTSMPVLPKDSLLYSEFMLLNEINPLKVNGIGIDIVTKKKIVEDLFVKSNKKVTKKAIKTYLVNQGIIQPNDVVSGIDDIVKSGLKSYHLFKNMISRYNNTEMIEDIIQAILVYGDDKKLLREWLKKNYPEVNNNDIAYVCRIKFKDWGRFSTEFLTEIYSADENGEARNIMDMLRDSNCNLMQLMSSEYSFFENAEAFRNDRFTPSDSIKSRLDDMYISPSTRRAVLQAINITDEIVDIMKSAPKKIFIEVARGTDNQKNQRDENNRSVSRKNMLLKLYEECGEKDSEIYNKLVNTEDSKLRDTTLYLYFIQLGKCMYTGEPIDLDYITDNSYYDIDHIYPQSRILDNSLDNRVLVKSIENREKSNVYPIKEEIRKKMKGFWNVLKDKKLISEKKFSRLVRSTELDENELAAFVQRQIVETQQSTKAVATLFKDIYAEANTKIVYSKACNVSEFRHKYNLIKCREINDLHHAKDAYLNIVVGNVYDTKFTEKFFMNIKNEEYSLNRVFDYDVSNAWVSEKTKTEKSASIVSVKNNYSKNSVRFTRRIKEGKGQISKATILPAGKGQLPIKIGLDIEKYGGYDSISGAYFFVVEHTVKKKRIRTFEPVYIYMKDLFISDPEKYCKDVLMLDNPVVINRKIPMESLIELDGLRYIITGRSGDVIVGKHAYQLVIDYEMTKYIKEIGKYLQKCSDLGEELNAQNISLAINKENNLKLYEQFMQKLSSGVYSSMLKNIKSSVENGANKFNELGVFEQCKLLFEILKAFKCDRQLSDLRLIGGSGKSGGLTFNKNYTKCSSAFVVHQSVTGLYEYKTDLLASL